MILRVLLTLSLAAIPAAALACSGGSKKPAETPTVTGVATAEREPTVTGTPQALQDGLTYIDTKAGTGAALVAGQSVSVYYSIYAREVKAGGTTDAPFTFKLGAGQVIAGMDKGVATMRVGGSRRLFVAPELAFGSAGFGGASGLYQLVPPNTPVVVDVTVLSAE